MKEHRVSGAARQVIAIVVAILFFLPIALLVAGSVREAGPLAPIPDLLPVRPTLQNYGLVLDATRLMRQAWNSTVVAAIVVPLSVFVAAAAGFAIARLPTAPRRALLALTLIAAMIPLSMLIVGRFALFRIIGLTDSYLPLIATGLIGGSPFNVLLFYVAFRRMPVELFDAATLDGASPVRTWLHVGLPGVVDVVIAVALICFAASWGNVLEPLVYISDESQFTLPLGLRSLATLDLPNQPIMLAGAVLSLIAPFLVLLVVQRRVVEIEDRD